MAMMKKKTARILRFTLMIAVLIWWGVMLYSLIEKNKGLEPVEIPDINVVEAGEILSEDYYSITFRGEKIGFSTQIKRRLQTGQLMYQESSFYRLPVGGVEHEVISQSVLTVDDSLRTQVLTFDFSADNYETSVNAVVDSASIRVSVESAQGVFTEEYPIENAIYSSAVIPEILARRGFPVGQFELSTFDPLTSSERKFTVQVLGDDRLERFGSRKVKVVKLSYGQLSSRLFIDTTGVLLMENSAEGFMSVHEDKETALSLDMRTGGSRDLLDEFALPLGMGVIERPRDAVEVVISIENLSPGIFALDDFNQIWDSEKELLAIKSSGWESRLDYSPPDTLDLAETSMIQCKDRRIISAAEKASKGAEDDLERLIAINEHLFKNIKKGHTLSIPSAIDVLQKMRGDCNEHTILFTAMARALDIPARMNVGLVYLDGYYYYHAWPQAFAGGRWHSFDPTLGQYPADAAHIKLTSGSLDEYLALLRMGDARMKLVSVKYSDGEVYETELVKEERDGDDGN